TYLGGVYLYTPSISFFKNILRFYPHMEIEKTTKANQASNTMEVTRGANVPQNFIDELGNIKLPAKMKFGDYRDDIITELVAMLSEEGINRTRTDKIGYVDK
ncbi:MAG: hypothetical protein AAF573_19890, partial [Bacteroidota bacterium]